MRTSAAANVISVAHVLRSVADVRINNAALRRGENVWKALDDAAVIEALANKTIVWRVAMTGKTDKATLPPHDAKLTKVARYVTSAGRKVRTIEFVSTGAYGSFRAVRLRNIIRVEGK